MTIRKKLIRYMNGMFNERCIEYLLNTFKTNAELMDFLDLTPDDLDSYFQ